MKYMTDKKAKAPLGAHLAPFTGTAGGGAQ
ncbi:Uncharacterised protein [Serratia entomophila]|nr:Uncharacterised protein [Serratia entomophila]CAI0846740.1 Uncharacterised protein [Serratia entomophila]CAI0852392.1 Uncharacterised protein [Serratia entomophila]CAI0877166.1 Uncharacterised protein [Serratia entomophila]CAI0913547.1 Uncharacterised protein [Serratia entomophila]